MRRGLKFEFYKIRMLGVGIEEKGDRKIIVWEVGGNIGECGLMEVKSS